MFHKKHISIMSLSDEEFRKQHQPLHVPASYDAAQTLTDKVVFALADIGEGNAEQIIKHIEELAASAEQKPVIAATHQILTDLFQNGRLTGIEKDGELIYNLHKITIANGGGVNPDLLAPGLD